MDDTAQTKPTQPVANDAAQTPSAQPQPQPQVQDQFAGVQPVGRHPEHAPILAPTPVAEVSTTGPDTVSDAADVADSQQAPDVVVAEAQPEIPQELKDVGIEHGEDAKQGRPEEQQQVDVVLPKEQPYALPVVGAQPLPMDYQEAILTQQTSKIRDSVKWLAMLIKYQWEKLQAKGENA